MLILLSKQPERRIAFVSESHALIIKCVSGKKSDKPLCSIELIGKNQLANQGFKKLTNREIHGLIGLVEINGLIFVGAITGKSKVAQPIPKETVNKIFAVEFYCLNDSLWDFIEIDSSGYPLLPEQDQQQDFRETFPRHPCFEIRKLLSNGSFYYSSDFDLTSTLQNRGFSEHSLSKDNFEEEYMWNSFLMQEMVTYRNRLDEHDRQILDDEGFLTTIIRGIAETFITYVGRLKVAVTMISKQSWKRAGTRFNARGVDDDSNVANFVETEFIMYSSQYCYSFTQIRGSIPVFWEQDTSLINPKVQITRSMEATQPIFDRHFERLTEKYGTINVVNLLSTKSSEIELSNRYKNHLKQSQKFHLGEDVFLTEFDFHRETSQDGFSAVKRIIPRIMDSLLSYGYFSYDVKDKKIISEQQGIFRTNCLDCLDRTNLVQQTISYCAFKVFLQDFQLIKQDQYIDDDNFIIQHNTLWADNGDQVSQIYTGTNALKSSFSRKGKMSLAGALSDATKSVSRMYINNFMDKGKQQNIDALLGRLPHQQAVQLYDPINEFISVKLEDLKDEYISQSTANILVGTFNANGMSRKSDLSKWLFPIGDKFKPDIVVLGLQEVIELTAGSILNADYSKSTFWQNLVSDCLNQYDEKYMLLRVEQMTSLMILFFVKSDVAKHVKQVEGCSKKTGFGGMTGNKGSVSIRFDYGGTSFCFVNAHLSAGANNVDERRNDFLSIFKSTIFSRSKALAHHDSIFWLGDLNYRISLPNEDVRKELASRREGYIEKLLKYDQLTQEINAGVVFKGFKEPSIKFRPTYKYDFGTDRYDTSEKARTPSWTDRIIYRGQNLQPLAYSDAQLLTSDHRPVYAAYRAKVVHINEAIKENLQKKLYKEYKAAHPDATIKNASSNNFLLDMEDKGHDSEQGGISLLDFDSPGHKPYNNNNSDLTPSMLDFESVHSPSSSSLASQPLQPRTVSSQSIASDRSKLPPPPPPASRFNANTPGSSNNLAQSGSHSSISTDSSIPASSTTEPPQLPKARKALPPGFSDTVLLPKNSGDKKTTPSPPPSRTTSSTSVKHEFKSSFSAEPLQPVRKSANSTPTINKNDVTSPQRVVQGRSQLPPPPSNKLPDKSSSTLLESSKSDNTSEKKKTPPVVPAKKPEIGNISLDSWKPLTPK